MTLIQVEDYNHIGRVKLLNALVKTREHQYGIATDDPIESFIAELEHRLGWHQILSNCSLCKEMGRV
jgi:hypothetical protein